MPERRARLTGSKPESKIGHPCIEKPGNQCHGLGQVEIVVIISKRRQRAHYPDLDSDLVLGGLHLAGGVMEQRIDATVADLAEQVRPRILAPGHCTGWRAKAALAKQFAPGHYAPSVVGTTFSLEAPT